jgi:predicted PurR-regulated permease PerM
MNGIPATALRQVLLLLLLAAVGGLLLWALRPTVPALLTAYTLYILLRGPVAHATQRWRWPAALAAGLAMLLSLLFLSGLFRLIGGALGNTLHYLVENPQQWLQPIEAAIRTLEQRYGVPLLTPDALQRLGMWVAGQARALFNATLQGLGTLLLGYFVLYFMLTQHRALEHGFRDWLPLKPANAVYLRQHLDTLVYANALGIPFMGFVQGLAGLLMYWLLGIPNIGLWFVATCITGMLPFIGVALVYVPMSLLLLAQGNSLQAIVILVYGFVVIGSVDNLARMWLLQKTGHTHPLVTLLGVIAGVPLFGFIGFIFGPILLSLFLILAKLYLKEFHPTDA